MKRKPEMAATADGAPVERWPHRERDFPKGKLSLKGWNALVDLVCVFGDLRFEEQAWLADIHARVPSTKGRVTSLKQMSQINWVHWLWAWETARPDLVQMLEQRRAETADSIAAHA